MATLFPTTALGSYHSSISSRRTLLKRQCSLEQLYAEKVDLIDRTFEHIVSISDDDSDDGGLGGGIGDRGIQVGSESDLDDDDEGIPVSARVYVFFTFSLGVQMFMSYAGGAVPTSLPRIVDTLPPMSNSQVGLLGSLDKVGQIVTSPLIGWLMQRCDTKLMLSVGLFINALFTLQFGFLEHLNYMMMARFMQGVSEAQQIVWGNLWTSSRAPPKQLPMWMNLGGVAAAVGTAIGTAVAGFSSTYSFTFTVQAFGLGALFIFIVLTPAHWLSLPPSDGMDGFSAEDLSPGSRETLAKRESGRLPTRVQLRLLLKNRLYLTTALCIAQNSFIAGGVQFFWTNFFVSDLWKLSMKAVAASNLVINGIGMGLGIVFGPVLVNSVGGYQTDYGRYATLKLLVKLTAFGTLGAAISIFGIIMQVQSSSLEGMFVPASGPNVTAAEAAGSMRPVGVGNTWLWVVWLGTIPMNFALSAQVGVQIVINIGSVPTGMQEFAQGITTFVQNLIGYAGGVFFPSAVMDGIWYVWVWTHKYEINEGNLQAIGFSVVCGVSLLLLVTVHLTMKAALVRYESGGDSSSGIVL